ncbi:MAG: replication-associated recombination protein A [Alphaproteobacteria bacterium]|nr:replication-associated recombination protein A [Alphaproteobacteria bacterium]
MRPADWKQIVGQERWLGPDGLLRAALDRGELLSMVLWGPPGCGKTTLARALADATEARFVQISAVLDGVKRLRDVVDQAERDQLHGIQTVLFVDEIHRWNKAQQDALLPHVESGTVVLIGATTENPSFELNAALRSRVQMVRMEPLTTAEVRILLQRAVDTEVEVDIDEAALDLLADAAGGDARRALGDLERVARAARGKRLDPERVVKLLQRSDVRHDRGGEDHYNVMSALIKSLRGSDAQAAIYWLARLLAGGEPPRAIARRLVIFAAEDVGNADPRALGVAVDVAQAVELTGMPEARIPLAQAVTWLATCPKSNRAYKAIDAALAEVQRSGALEVPLHLRNAATAEMRAEGYGVGYLYPHDHPHGIVKQAYLPDRLRGARFYEPTRFGAEKLIAERLDWWARRLEEE